MGPGRFRLHPALLHAPALQRRSEKRGAYHRHQQPDREGDGLRLVRADRERRRILMSADAGRLMEEPMLKRMLAAALGVGLVCAAASAWAAPAPADANYFKGKTVTYIVATGAGGGYDTYGRLIARFMGKYLPGSRILVRNVPGAGHIIGANTIYTARPDGLTFGMFNTGLIYNQLMGLPGIKFDLTKFSWIGKASDEIRVMVVSTKSGYKSIDDVMKVRTPIKFAAAGVGSAAYLDTRILDFA